MQLMFMGYSISGQLAVPLFGWAAGQCLHRLSRAMHMGDDVQRDVLLGRLAVENCPLQ
jgi:hypothetical protein